MTNSPNIALLTATVTPPAWVPKLMRSDPAVRLGDYLQAFPVYLDHLANGTFDALVLVENSGHDLSQFATMAKDAGLQDHVDLISYDGMSTAPKSDRFYAECSLLKEALVRASRLTETPDATIWKLTGRYVFDNLTEVLHALPKGYDLYLHDMRPGQISVVFGLAGFRAGIMADVLDRFQAPAYARDCNESYVLALLDRGVMNDLRVVTRFPVSPKTRSIAAISNQPYGEAKARIKDQLRVLKRNLNPFYDSHDLVYVPDIGRMMRRKLAKAKRFEFVEP
ncbi:hypothetical protein [Pseudoprimorskyibacter insulae]|uniref:Uncharacterized protein n=1 Tax=Pseudoprimorskyibacter insulae TaxID=1695997 RepID=A0A2R8APF8_9RHOB|nr:hypothetical protein [Pseudoprimorskyibacter insulae]SPF77744.1 hypothetical protein PRI8871_00329 [Pseudoprimorskyibacter insulae]